MARTPPRGTYGAWKISSPSEMLALDENLSVWAAEQDRLSGPRDARQAASRLRTVGYHHFSSLSFPTYRLLCRVQSSGGCRSIRARTGCIIYSNPSIGWDAGLTIGHIPTPQRRRSLIVFQTPRVGLARCSIASDVFSSQHPLSPVPAPSKIVPTDRRGIQDPGPATPPL